MRFLVDEDLLRSAALRLTQAGHQADHVRDVGLRGGPDREVFQWAQDHQAVVVTGDMGFASTVTFPLGSHWGIVVLRGVGDLDGQGIPRGGSGPLRRRCSRASPPLLLS